MDTNIIISDLDGVLTDGKLNIDSKGKKTFKSFCTRDVRAIRELISRGFEFYIVSADEWSGSKYFADKVGAEFIHLRDKIQMVHRLKGKPFIGVGDDSWDISFLEKATHAYCPSDAHDNVMEIRGINIMKAKGGTGVIAELLDIILKAQ